MSDDGVVLKAVRDPSQPKPPDPMDYMWGEIERLQHQVELMQRAQEPKAWECPRCNRMNAPHAWQCGCNQYGKYPR